jgi:hypothetical protein
MNSHKATAIKPKIKMNLTTGFKPVLLCMTKSPYFILSKNLTQIMIQPFQAENFVSLKI